jgi:release factor glutamine methyltransferase
VLIPRPETELIVEAALELFGGDRRRRLDVADACTGCGNLAVALAHELAHASIVATDISAPHSRFDEGTRSGTGADRIRFFRANVPTTSLTLRFDRR